jgi:16S rRNA (guanine1207-N2)-methyltransferase
LVKKGQKEVETLLNVAQGQFELQRLPQRKHEKLRAWDAADDYLLQYLFEHCNLSSSTKILIINDGFGALAVALHAFNPIAISDSYLSRQATLLNLAKNDLPEDCVQLRNSLDWPKQQVDLVLIKVPKTLALLEQQLIQLQSLLTAETKIIAAGMVKAMSASVWKLMDRYLGSTKPSLAKKKARLIFISLDIKRARAENPYPVYYQLENTRFRICNHANVFSRESLDIGTRFLLLHLPKKTNAKDIVDLGCGNGVVGLLLADYNRESHLYFVDESYMAVASAKETFHLAFEHRQADFCVADGLTGFETESMDLIVCNPPFHQQNTVGNQVALSMFKQSKRVLRKGGELWVIGNRHLAYHVDLKKIFKNCNEIASNAKFIIWQVSK